MAAADRTGTQPPGLDFLGMPGALLPLRGPAHHSRQGGLKRPLGLESRATESSNTVISNLFPTELCWRAVAGHSVKLYMVFN